MLREFGDSVYAFLYQKLLDNYEKFLPKRFLHNEKIPKGSLEFKIYIKILEIYMYTLKSIDQRDRPFATKLQERRLKKILALANKTKWWKSYFEKNQIRIEEIGALEDLRKIPPVNRFNLLDVPKEDLLTCSRENPRVVWCQTSGSTTGTPFVWGLNQTIPTVHMLARVFKELEGKNFSLQENGLQDFHMTFNHPRQNVLNTFKWFSTGNFFLKSGDPDTETRIREISETITRLKKAVILCNGNELKFLIDTLRDHDLHPPVLSFYILGRSIEEPLRTLVTQYLGSHIITIYGIQEMGSIGLECRDHHGKYHVLSERMIAEIVDDNGYPVPPRTVGNITLTCLDNTVMPLIRYQPGDTGMLDYGITCRCDNKSPLLKVQGRNTDVIKFSSGETRSLRGITLRFSAEPFVSSVRRFQIQQPELDAVRILLEVRKSLSDEVIMLLKQQVEEAYHWMLTSIDIEQTDAIPQEGLKFNMFIPLQTIPPTAS